MKSSRQEICEWHNLHLLARGLGAGLLSKNSCFFSFWANKLRLLAKLPQIAKSHGLSKLRPGGSVDQCLLVRITLMRSRIRVRIEMKSWIRIRIKVMRI